MKFVVRLFPEITIKSAPVRKRLTKLLTESLRVRLKRIDESAKVIRDWDKLEVEIREGSQHSAEIIDSLGCTPGIAHFFQVSSYPFESVDDICQLALKAWGSTITDKTFCVRVKRTGKHEFTSTDVERSVGSVLNMHTNASGVKLKDPDITLNIEIKDQTAYLVEKRFPGLGGFPVGTQEEVLSLISGGFDSSVASFLTMKRGLKTHFCFFNLGGAEHEIAVKEVAWYLWNRYSSSHRVKFISVPFEEVVSEILQNVSPANMGVVLKRMMLRAAERIAEKGRIDALVTGEAIGQVSSQTLPNLSVIDEVCNKLVLRPLITMDKRDIIAVSRQIGAEEFSAAIPEYCGVISVKPSARVKRESLLAEEESLDSQVLARALEQVEVLPIDEVMNRERHHQKLESFSVVSQGQIIIDVRHQNERELKQLTVPEGAKVLEIPFYKLSSEFKNLDGDRQYLLYCDKGVMSMLHALHLLDEGYANVAVYRP